MMVYIYTPMPLPIQELPVQWSGDPTASPSGPRNGPIPTGRPCPLCTRAFPPPSGVLNLHVPYLTSTWPLQILHSSLRHPRTHPQRLSLCKIFLSVVY